MKRRDFVKIAGSALIVPIVLGGSKVSAQPKIDYTPKEEVFELIFNEETWNSGCLIEYPLSLLHSDVASNPAFVSNGEAVEKLVEGDYIVLDPLKMTYKTEVKSGLELIAACGMDRNMVVYDGDFEGGYFSKRLVSLLKVTSRRNSSHTVKEHGVMFPKCIDTILVDKSVRYIYDQGKKIELGKEKEVLGVKIIRTDFSDFNEIFNYTGAKLNCGKKQFIIGISSGDSFIRAKQDGKTGLAVLDNTSITLGMI